MRKTVMGLGAAALLLASQSMAAPVKIGLITTLSGGGAALGIDTRDGFELAVRLADGKLGGVATELIVADDAQKVETAKQIAERMLKKDDVDFVAGIVWSNLALAVVPTVTRAGKFYVSTNAGPSQLAGKGCDPNYFNAAYQNDNLHEAAGKTVADKGYKRVYLIAPNYPAGKDSISGFRRFYTAEPLAEVYTKLGQEDYAAEIANLRAAKPDAVFIFLPGGMGVNFIKQYAQAGLKNEIPLFGPAFSFDQGILAAVGEAAVGTYNTSWWSKDIDTAANKRFVDEFVKTFNRLPSLYAAQAFEAANLIGGALKAVKGDVANPDAVRAALRAAKFDTVRGTFKMGHNQHPVQDIFLREVVKEGDVVTNHVIGTVFKDRGDAYAGECVMPK